MSYIAAGTKLENLPLPRVWRDRLGDECARPERSSTHQARQVLAMKRGCPGNMSLKKFANQTPTGRAWLKRKRESR